MRILLAAIAACVAIAPPTTARASVVSWDSTAPLVVAPMGTAKATLRNDTARTVVVTIRLTGPLKATRMPRKLAPGAERDIKVTSTGRKKGQGTLSAVATPRGAPQDGGVVRREVKVALITPKAAITSAKLHSTWGILGDTTGAVIPLSAPKSCNKAAAPPPTAGYVRTEDGKQAHVTYSCVKGSSTAIGARLTFHGIARTGAKYDGDIKIGDTKVSVTVTRGTTAVYPIILLMLGLLLALYVLGQGPRRVVALLLRRLRVTQAAIGTASQPGGAIVDFRQAAGTAPWRDLDIFDDAKNVADEVERDLNGLSRAKRFTLTEDDKEAVEIGTKLATLETAASSLPKFAQQLLALQAALPVVQSSSQLPAWTARLHNDLLSAKKLTVAQVPEQLAAAGDSAAVAAWWPGVAQQIRNLQDRIDELMRDLQQRPTEERRRITVAQGKFNAALGAFSLAETSAEVRAAHADEFAKAQNSIDALASLTVITKASFAGSLRGVMSVAISAPDQYLAGAHAIEAGQRRASLVTIVIVGAALMVAGLQAVYIGKTFGTGWDFLIALTWGLGAAVVVTPLASAIEGLVVFNRKPEPRV